jgi:hypothetical protein
MKEPEYTGQAGAATRTESWPGFATPLAFPAPPASVPPPGPPRSPGPTRDGSIVKFVPLLAVLACAAVGVYIAWRQGAAGGGLGGIVGGAALLAAAVARLVFPAGLVGLLATRKRATDVLTLTAFGVGLLVVGLILPR